MINGPDQQGHTIMQPNHRRSLAKWLVIVLPGLAAAAGPLEEPKPAQNDDRTAAIIEAVRAEEAKYRDFEYTVKITTRKVDPNAPDQPAEVKSLETRRVVLQGDRFFFRSEPFERVLATKFHRQEISAFDGEQTRTIVSGNSVNIHIGRYEHPDVYPAHSLPLAHNRVNFPLSVYLGRTEAMHADPSDSRSLHRSARSTRSRRRSRKSKARKRSTASVV